MNDIIVEVDVSPPGAEASLAEAIEIFAKWRASSSQSNPADTDAPDIMVKTRFDKDTILKTLIFQDAGWANKFMAIWQAQSATPA
ncbi:MAG: hypothetical protein AAGJ50_02515 [Pseudomonadota bacterium]